MPRLLDVPTRLPPPRRAPRHLHLDDVSDIFMTNNT